MDIPALAEAEKAKAGLPGQVGAGRAGGADTLEPQAQGSRPVWAGPSWPMANSQGGARSMLSGSSPYGKSIDMADAMHNFSETGAAALYLLFKTESQYSFHLIICLAWLSFGYIWHYFVVPCSGSSLHLLLRLDLSSFPVACAIF